MNCPRDTVWNITITKCYSTSSRTFVITRESEDEQKPVLVSAHPLPKISLHGNLNTSAPKHGT